MLQSLYVPAILPQCIMLSFTMY